MLITPRRQKRLVHLRAQRHIEPRAIPPLRRIRRVGRIRLAQVHRETHTRVRRAVCEGVRRVGVITVGYALVQAEGGDCGFGEQGVEVCEEEGVVGEFPGFGQAVGAWAWGCGDWDGGVGEAGGRGAC